MTAIKIRPGRIYRTNTGLDYLCLDECRFRVTIRTNTDTNPQCMDVGTPGKHVYLRWTKTLDKRFRNGVGLSGLISFLAEKHGNATALAGLVRKTDSKPFESEVRTLFDPDRTESAAIGPFEYPTENGLITVRYEIMAGKKGETIYSLVNIAREYEAPDGRVLVDGSWLQHSCRGFAMAIWAARTTEAANGNKIKIAVVPEIPGSGISLYGPYTGLERLDAGPSFQTPAEGKNIR